MPHYSPERKEAILQKMAPPQSLTVAELSSQALARLRQLEREQPFSICCSALFLTPDIYLLLSDSGGACQHSYHAYTV
jgi:hypothetical protein